MVDAGLPGWSDLTDSGKSKKKNRRTHSRKTTGNKRALDITPTLRFAVITMLLCIGVTLYVGHVFATRTTLAELQAASRDNLRLHLTEDRLKGEFNRMTSPHQVMDRAAALGLEEGITYGPTISIQH